MATLYARIRLVLTALAFLLCAAAAAPIAAQAPGSVNPNAAAVKEEQLLQRFYRIEGRGTIPDAKSYVLEQPMGRTWRLFHQVWLRWIAAVLILGVIALMVLWYLSCGRIRIEGGRSGRKVPRFNSFERFTHWLATVSFIVLALTGLNITFGRVLLLPLLGPQAFAWWSIMAKYAHNFSTLPFVIGVVVLFLLWVKENIPRAVDIRWFMEGGGMFGHGHPPAWKFNGGEKVLFWLVMFGTVGGAATGVFLLFPFYLTNILGMQIVEAIHALIAVAFIGVVIMHLYIATLGMEGGFDAMGGGEVDLNWAKQHHDLWVERQLGQGRAAAPSAGAGTTPAA